MNFCLKSGSFTTTKWSGGSTTKLFIYPSTSDYKALDFDFRLSSANIESEKSDFTRLPGVSRKIMVLDGEIEITHLNHYRKNLKKFDIDSFQGEWETTSFGQCTDFNLMTTGHTSGDIEAILIPKLGQAEINLNDRWNWLFIYAFNGLSIILADHNTYLLEKGDLFILEKSDEKKLSLYSLENSELILAKIIISKKKFKKVHIPTVDSAFY